MRSNHHNTHLTHAPNNLSLTAQSHLTLDKIPKTLTMHRFVVPHSMHKREHLNIVNQRRFCVCNHNNTQHKPTKVISLTTQFWRTVLLSENLTHNKSSCVSDHSFVARCVNHCQVVRSVARSQGSLNHSLLKHKHEIVATLWSFGCVDWSCRAAV